MDILTASLLPPTVQPAGGNTPARQQPPTVPEVTQHRDIPPATQETRPGTPLTPETGDKFKGVKAELKKLLDELDQLNHRKQEAEEKGKIFYYPNGDAGYLQDETRYRMVIGQAEEGLTTGNTEPAKKILLASLTEKTLAKRTIDGVIKPPEQTPQTVQSGTTQTEQQPTTPPHPVIQTPLTTENLGLTNPQASSETDIAEAIQVQTTETLQRETEQHLTLEQSRLGNDITDLEKTLKGLGVSTQDIENIRNLSGDAAIKAMINAQQTLGKGNLATLASSALIDKDPKSIKDFQSLLDENNTRNPKKDFNIKGKIMNGGLALYMILMMLMGTVTQDER